MTGHELIKVYDKVPHRICLGLLDGIREGVASLETVEDSIGNVLRDFIRTYPALTTNWTESLELTSAEYLNTHTHGRTYHPEADVVATVLFIVDGDLSVDFPLQGINFDGRGGRFVAFPAFWTHPYQVMGSGQYLRFQLRRSKTPWSRSRLSNEVAIGGNQLIAI